MTISTSDIRISLVEKDPLRAMVTVKIGGFFLTGIRVIHGTKGLFVSMASKKEANGEYKDIFYPESKDVRNEFQAAILAEYHRLKGVGASAQQEQAPTPSKPMSDDDIPF